ncbi:MAG: STAS domain-containing protein [Smithella sp.]
MEIDTAKENNKVIVSVKGKIDAVTAPEFEKTLADLIVEGEKAFLINFDGLEYISSAGLRSILSTAKQLRPKNGNMIFCGLKGPVRDVFKISGFDTIFKIYNSREEALK